jgi:KDO2-lipid IV(A) lauroyltransferase
MLLQLFRLFARLPLPLIHGLGCVIGWGMYLISGRVARRMRINLMNSGVAHGPEHYRQVLRRNISESGKSVLETFAIWFRPQHHVLQWVRSCHGWEHVEAAWRDQRGIIFLTPHLGCFEITAQYYAAHRPISVLYRPPRMGWLEPLIQAGRARGLVKLAPATLKGVRDLLKALKQGEAVGILPDQRPAKGEGEWAGFFNRPAYTMTLVGRLAEATGATVLMAFGERLSWGRGYVIHIAPLDTTPDTRSINAAIEKLVSSKPEQYLWSYPRHRRPRGAPPPPKG